MTDLAPPPAAEIEAWEEQQAELREEKAGAGQELRLTIMVRTYVPRVDQGVVLASWCRQIRKLRPYRAMTGAEFKCHSRRLERLLERCPPVMACAPTHPDQVFGWACGELQGDDRVLHFAYTRATWRQHGIARYLLELVLATRLGDGPIYCSHRGRSTPHLETKWRLEYAPDRLEAPE